MDTSLKLFFVLFGATALVSAQDADVGCYVAGECLGAAFTDFSPLDDPAECHELCIEDGNCKFWTHYDEGGDDTGCFAYLNCPEFSDGGCDNCISGNVGCPVPGDCEVTGRCEGTEIDFIVDTSLEDCAAKCACDPGCAWWSFDEEFENCILTSDCPFIDRSCEDCVSGEKECDAFTCDLVETTTTTSTTTTTTRDQDASARTTSAGTTSAGTTSEASPRFS